MDMSSWHEGRGGTLAPAEQAKVWALIYVRDKLKIQIPQEDIANAVVKVGGGHPGQGAISKLIEKFSSDPKWYPGKQDEDAGSPGRKLLFTPQKQQAAANAAMAIKRAGFEPTVAAVIQRCPVATLNPETHQPFSDPLITQVFRSRCFDDGAEEPWGHISPFHKTALSPVLVKMRWDWAKVRKKEDQPEHWFHQNVIFIDPCSTVLSDSLKTGFDETQASYGKGKRWQSADSQRSSRNLRASPYATKQCRYGDKRVWWFIVLARGKVGVMVMDDDWAQTGEGMADFVSKLAPFLKKMLGADARLPRILCSDRGPGLYQTSTGHIVEAYRQATAKNGFRTFAGSDASRQPADMPDFWPHETAVSWLRALMKKRPLQKGFGLDHLQDQLEAALGDCVKHINDTYDVDSLCRSFPRRVDELIASKGERLGH